MRAFSFIAAAIGAAFVAGCGEPAGPDLPPELTEMPGLLIDGPPPLESLVAPDIVSKGLPFLVTATSFGSSSCTEPAGYSSITFQDRVEISLRDRVALEASSCTEDLRGFPRTLIVAFDQAGTAEVVVIGRDEQGEPLEIRRTITVLEAQ
jgi:hypothetical protein